MTYLITFIAVFLTDILYIYFIKSIQDNNAVQAAFWSVVVTATASITVINYTENHWTLIPALAGAFFGTLVGMRVRKKFGV
jgi:uncharacterized membrane protein YfcA